MVSAHRQAVKAAVEALLAAQPDVAGRTLFGCPAWFEDGRMFACAYGDGLALKLPAHVAQERLDSHRAQPFQPYGRAAMNGWIVFGVTSASDPDDAARELLAVALDFARAPQPSSTKRGRPR
ncbi:TfoX/Sxy family protein [Paraburkholderia caballeronis]|uniref:TfoX/Sxy family protein n=1 Tax=Paraburkholderia caballeronis TaxID=416943 RepID=UPI001064F90D|nr:TfoX/Sxy family protein [Paraburkholderia caballeronis]TDV07854.1 TfoX-like protein [Paraburkholderia caballeronis]TDV11217.1 TfoX-like protein [Paraburkholderia caballeronis]TDV21597.1 TfoX-like protein [Paraburkholderia caballeronis]